MCEVMQIEVNLLASMVSSKRASRELGRKSIPSDGQVCAQAWLVPLCPDGSALVFRRQDRSDPCATCRTPISQGLEALLTKGKSGLENKKHLSDP